MELINHFSRFCWGWAIIVAFQKLLLKRINKSKDRNTRLDPTAFLCCQSGKDDIKYDTEEVLHRLVIAISIILEELDFRVAARILSSSDIKKIIKYLLSLSPILRNRARSFYEKKSIYVVKEPPFVVSDQDITISARNILKQLKDARKK